MRRFVYKLVQPLVPLALLAVMLACGGQPPSAVPLPSRPPPTLAPPNTLTPHSPPATATPPAPPVVIEACSLLTKPEAETALGEQVREAIAAGSACRYRDAATGVHLVGVFAAQGEQARGLMQSRLFQLGAYGLRLDPAAVDTLTALDQAGDHRAYLELLGARSLGQTTFNARAPAGLGEAAFWAWKTFDGGVSQAFLLVSRAGVSAGVDLVVGPTQDETAALAAATAVLVQVFDRLPASFVLPLVPSVTPPAEPAAAPLTGALIAFETDRDGAAQIYVMRADGTAPRRVTYNAAAGNHLPAWSPDGTRIAFTAWLTRDAASAEICVVNADGTGEARLTHNTAADQAPAWSPDGTRLAFASERDGNAEIYVMNADGAAPTRLTHTPEQEGHPAWSPDGTRLAFYSTRTGAYQIFVMNADGSGQTQLTTSPGVHTRPAWSPDGALLAFVQRDEGGAHLYTLQPDGAGLSQLTHNAEQNYWPSWSPDGLRLAYTALTDGSGEIMVMNADGSGQTNLTHHPAADAFPAWQP